MHTQARTSGRWSVWLLILSLLPSVGATTSNEHVVNNVLPVQGHDLPHGNRQAGLAPSIQAIVTTKMGVVYAGSFGMGMFRSQDNGGSWELFNSGLTDTFILCLGVDHHDTIYVGTVRGGIFRTNVDQTGWERVSQGLKRVEVKSLLMHNHELFAGTGRGVDRWIEHERQWVVVGKGLDQLLVSSLVMMDNGLLLAGTLGRGLYMYDTKGSSSHEWKAYRQTLVDPKEGLTHRFIRIVAMGEDQGIYVGTQDGGIFHSQVAGAPWTSIGRSLPNDSIRSIVPTAFGVFVATGRGIYKKTEQRRKQWAPMNEGITELSLQVLMISQKGIMYAGTSSGAFRSDNGGQQWINISEGFGLQPIIPGPYHR